MASKKHSKHRPATRKADSDGKELLIQSGEPVMRIDNGLIEFGVAQVDGGEGEPAVTPVTTFTTDQARTLIAALQEYVSILTAPSEDQRESADDEAVPPGT